MFGQRIQPTQYDLHFVLFGVPVRVHPVFWVTAAFIGWRPGQLDLVFINVMCIFVSVLVHEMGHALVTQRFGWRPEITLEFFGGYATTAGHGTWKNIAVLIAGPACGFLLMGLALIAMVYGFSEEAPPHPLIGQGLSFLFFINLAWSLVNLLPVFPLDGGQITRELLCWLFPRGFEYSMKLSIVFSGGIAAWAFYAHSQGCGLFGLDPFFLGILFGVLCYQSVQSLNRVRSGPW
jgi:Zn-dependent protease